MRVSLVRVGQSDMGTFGVLRWGQIPFAITLEQLWLENAPDISCIPTGQYTCRRQRSPRFGETFEVTNVPNRSHILFHKGNTMEDTRGCILVAEEFSGTFDKPMIVSSERGFHEFLEMLEGQSSFDLTIVTIVNMGYSAESINISQHYEPRPLYYTCPFCGAIYLHDKAYLHNIKECEWREMKQKAKGE